MYCIVPIVARYYVGSSSGFPEPDCKGTWALKLSFNPPSLLFVIDLQCINVVLITVHEMYDVLLCLKIRDRVKIFERETRGQSLDILIKLAGSYW